jgi:anti-sigma factor RsiW
MLCADFENRLTDYFDDTLDVNTHQAFVEHAMRCPVCHDLLGEVKNTMQACVVAQVPAPGAELDARILLRTMPATVMSCEEFEECLTDYLDGYLPAALYHRWERHAALCRQCTDLPGEVVRSIGACYTYVGEERPVPAGLEARILQATLGSEKLQRVAEPFTTRLASRLRLWLDPIVSPQLASVATMLLIAVFVLTSTVSADGSISGMYSASLRLARQTYVGGATTAVKSAGLSDDLREIAGSVTELVNGGSQKGNAGTDKQKNENSQQK